MTTAVSRRLGMSWRDGRTTSQHEARYLGHPWSVGWVALLSLVAMGIASRNPYYATVVCITIGYVISALGYNLALGYCGQLAFGQAGFMATGAYFYAVAQSHGINTAVAFALALSAGTVAGAVIGIAVLRTAGFYLALVTLAFGEAIIVLIGLVPATQGENGIGLSLPASTSTQPGWWFPAFIFFLVVCVVERIVRSRFGRDIVLVKNDESLARAMGINPGAVRISVFAASGFFGALGGIVYGGGLGFISPDDFGSSLTLLLLAGIVVGGVGTNVGAIVGTAVLALLPVVFSISSGIQEIVDGLVLFIIIVVFPQGIAGTARKLVERRHGNRQMSASLRRSAAEVLAGDEESP